MSFCTGMKCPDCGNKVALSKSIGKQSGEPDECPECGTLIDKSDRQRRRLLNK